MRASGKTSIACATERRPPPIAPSCAALALVAAVTLGIAGAAQAQEGRGGRPPGTMTRPPSGGPPRMVRPPVNIPRPTDQIRRSRVGIPSWRRERFISDLSEFIKKTNENIDWRNSSWADVFGRWILGDHAGSVVSASQRANELAAALRKHVGPGKSPGYRTPNDIKLPEGYTVEVRTISGGFFVPGRGGFHSSTVVEVKDENGDRLKVYEIDTIKVRNKDIIRRRKAVRAKGHIYRGLWGEATEKKVERIE